MFNIIESDLSLANVYNKDEKFIKDLLNKKVIEELKEKMKEGIKNEKSITR